MKHPVDQAIIRTIVWFDLFDFPLLPLEVGRLLYGGPAHVTSEQVFTRLEQSPYLQRHLETTDGFYHRRGRGSIVAIRNQRYATTKRHREQWRFRLALNLLRCAPFVRFVALGNSAAYGNARASSDLDLFIVVQDGSLYTARWFITALFQAIGIRRHDRRVAGRACLSFYVTETGAALSPLLLPGQDPYFTFWAGLLWPLFDAGGQAQVKRLNNWLGAIFPTELFVWSWSPDLLTDSRVSRFIRTSLEYILSAPRAHTWLERISERVQQWKMKRHPCARARQPNASVVISSTVLKFHEDDRRHELRRRFFSQLRRYGAV